MSKKILLYITSDKERIISSEGLVVYITDENEKQQYILDFIKAFAGVRTVKMSNGDYILLK